MMASKVRGDTSLELTDSAEVLESSTEDGRSDRGVAETPIPPPRQCRRPQHLSDYVCD